MTADPFNTGGCNGCKWHGKSDETFWEYEDGTPRNDTCCRPDKSKIAMGYAPGEPIPVFNIGCKHYEGVGA